MRCLQLADDRIARLASFTSFAGINGTVFVDCRVDILPSLFPLADAIRRDDLVDRLSATSSRSTRFRHALTV